MPVKLNPLDSWLSSGPGNIHGATEQETLEKAHVSFLAHVGPLDCDEFYAALQSAGRLPAPQFRNGDTGEFEMRLQLPSKQPDHDNGA